MILYLVCLILKFIIVAIVVLMLFNCYNCLHNSMIESARLHKVVTITNSPIFAQVILFL